MEKHPYTPEEAQAAWDKILQPPPQERIQWLRTGYKIEIGDFGWASPKCPHDDEGIVHLTGYDEKMLTIWYADLKLAEVSYFGLKPGLYSKGRNPFPVKPPAPSVKLYLARLGQIFELRWSWWKTRHIRRENLRKYGKPVSDSRGRVHYPP